MTGAESTFGPMSRRIATACGCAAAVVGALVIVGWATDTTLLKQVDPDLPSLKPLAALALILLGAAVVLLAPSEAPSPRHRAGVVCGALVALIGLAVLAEWAFGSIGIDQLLFKDEGENMGRPAAVAAATLCVCGIATATLDRGLPRRRITLILQAVAAITLVTALVGLAYDVDYLRGRSGTNGVALHGTIALAFVILGLALSRPETGVVALLSGDDPASRFARRVGPLAILVPLVLGGLRLLGEHAGLFGDEIGLGLVTIGSMAILVAVTAISARDLRAETARGDLGERSLEAVAEASLDAIVSSDHLGRIIYFNPAATRLFGYTAEEAAGMTIQDLMPDRYRERHAGRPRAVPVDP